MFTRRGERTEVTGDPDPIAEEPEAELAGPEPLGLALVSGAPSPELIRELLHEVIDPELGVDIVELGLLRQVAIADGVADVRFTVTTPACPLSSYIEDKIRDCLWQVPGLHEILVECEYEPQWDPEDMSAVAREALGWSV